MCPLRAASRKQDKIPRCREIAGEMGGETSIVAETETERDRARGPKHEEGGRKTGTRTQAPDLGEAERAPKRNPDDPTSSKIALPHARLLSF